MIFNGNDSLAEGVAWNPDCITLIPGWWREIHILWSSFHLQWLKPSLLWSWIHVFMVKSLAGGFTHVSHKFCCWIIRRIFGWDDSYFEWLQTTNHFNQLVNPNSYRNGWSLLSKSMWYMGIRPFLAGWWFQSFFHNIWDNPSHWLSYFSRWLKPPTS